MAETKKKTVASSTEEKTTKAKTTKKPSTKSATTKKTSTRTKSNKTATVEVSMEKVISDKKATKAEEKAQAAKAKRAVKKTAEELAAQKAKEDAKAAKAAAEAEKQAQADIENLKKLAEATKRKTSTKKITSKKVKVETLAPATNQVQAEEFTKVIILNFDNKKLPKELFASQKIYAQAIFDTIMSERASRRQGTHDVKNRAEVRGGGRKPWRQKGTGRARAGSNRSPIWVGGGRAFGPTPERNYNLKVNKKVKKAAFVSALTTLANNKSVVVDDFKLAKISTKEAFAKLQSLKIDNLKHILVVTNDEVVYKSVNNLPNVVCTKPNSVLVEQLVWADVLVLSNEGLKSFEGRIK